MKSKVKKKSTKVKSKTATKQASSKQKSLKKPVKPKGRARKTEIRVSAPENSNQEKAKKSFDQYFTRSFGEERMHIIIFMLSLFALSLIFFSPALIGYFISLSAVLLIVHGLHFHGHRTYDCVMIISVLFLPLIITLLIFNDIWSWVVFALFLVSFITSVLIYFKHDKKYDLVEISWRMIYSHTLALALALILLFLIALIPSANFMGFISVIVWYLLPAVFLYFFFSKYYYVYFFDPKHPFKDATKSLSHSIVYTVIFAVVLISVYSFFAIHFSNLQNDLYIEQLEQNIDGLESLEDALDQEAKEVKDLVVYQELYRMEGNLRIDMENDLQQSLDHDVGFKDIVQDRFFRQIGEQQLQLVKYSVRGVQLMNLREQMVLNYRSIKNTVDNNKTFDDGSSTLEERLVYLRQRVDARYVPYKFDSELEQLLLKLDDPKTNYLDLKSDADVIFQGSFFRQAVGLPRLINFEVPFKKGLYELMSHSQLYKESARFIFKVAVYEVVEEEDDNSINMLYERRDIGESLMSRLVRYSLINDWVNHLEEKQVEKLIV